MILSPAQGWRGGLAPCFGGGNGGREEEGGGNSNTLAALTLLSPRARCKREKRKADTGGCRRADEEGIRQLEIG